MRGWQSIYSGVPTSLRKDIVEVLNFARQYVYSQNLFGRRYFMPYLEGDIRCVMVTDYEECRYRHIGYYKLFDKHASINYMSYCNADKRKGDFTLKISFENESLRSVPAKDDIFTIDVLTSIKQQFGKEVSDLIDDILSGTKLSASQLKLLRTPALRELLVH